MAGEITYSHIPSSALGHDMTIGDGELTSSASQTPLIERLAWLVAVLAILVQQGAYLSSPVLTNLVTEPGSADTQANIFNTIAIALNITLIIPLCLLHYRQLRPVIYGNAAALILIAFIFSSIAWSVHPDVTFRRSINYFSTVLTAFYLAGRFDIDEIMKILSWGIVIAAIGSFIFVTAFPIDAIHQPSPWQGENIAGAWKGVYSHKNVLGHTMTVGVIAELYILTGTKVRMGWYWHLLVLCACFALVILSRSSTSMLLALFYLLAAGFFLLFQRARQYFGVGLAMLGVFGLTVAAIYYMYPNLVLESLGSDATLTGRTELWSIVLRLISEKPIFGWGYQAMWLPTDSITIAISNAVGWVVPQAHNALLEVTLELGLVGLVIVLAFLGISLWRSVRCIIAGPHRLGIVSLVFFLGVIISGITEPTLAQNQTIEWVVFNILSLYCGLEIVRRQVNEIA
jgi:O-antigen ligase